jgi:cytochrome oxidase assembly protein ShyY1
MALCVKLGAWQYERYQLRHELTEKIGTGLSTKPITLTVNNQKSATAWMNVAIEGKYEPQEQALFRGHYFQDRYGLEVLSLFIPTDSSIPPIWVDRGWIETSSSAAATTPIPPPQSGEITVSGILKKYDEGSPSRGALFALPAPRIGRIDERTLQQTFSGETFFLYLKLRTQTPSIQSPSNGDQVQITPLTPPGEGPHLAYAIQWWLFALLIAGTRIALYRGERSL